MRKETLMNRQLLATAGHHSGMRLSRLVALVVLPALAPALVAAVPGSARAATPTCQGLPATIVGHGQSSMVGTPGDDVVVTRGVQIVGTGGGDDTVCVTALGDRRTTQLSTGRGDDRVVNTAGREVQVDLGLGSDSYVGGAGRDDVTTGDDEQGSLDERDTVRTGAGADTVSSGSGYGELADDVDLGSGRDTLYLSGRVAGGGARFVGGTASDELRLYGPLPSDIDPDAPADPLGGADWVIANTPTTGTAEADGEVRLTWRGFERFVLGAEAASYRFIGSDRDESVDSYTLTDALMAGGDDTVITHIEPQTGTIDGGPGRDLADLGACQGLATADLARDTYRCQESEATTTVALPGLEDLAVIAQRARLRGSEASEKLVAEACRGTVTGLGGNDRLRSRTFTDDGWAPPYCEVPINGVVALDGGRGNDTLYGRWGPDRLLGGPGRDRAYGGVGRDTCRAELELSCER